MEDRNTALDHIKAMVERVKDSRDTSNRKLAKIMTLNALANLIKQIDTNHTQAELRDVVERAIQHSL